MKYKISFVCNWGLNSQQLLNLYRRQTPNNSGIWKNIIGVGSVEKSDFVINLGKQTNFRTDKPVIQFRREPDLVETFVSYKDSYEVYDYSDKKFHVSVWPFMSKNYDELNNLEYSKTNKISVVTSNKWEHRVNYLKSIEKYTEIDFWGRRYKGLGQYKDDGIFPYEYSISIENSSQPNYFTEKINDCFLLWAKPLYWGCPNIGEYFPEGSYELLDLSNPKQIKEYFDKTITEKDIELLTEARDLVLNKYNMWDTINRIITN